MGGALWNCPEIFMPPTTESVWKCRVRLTSDERDAESETENKSREEWSARITRNTIGRTKKVQGIRRKVNEQVFKI